MQVRPPKPKQTLWLPVVISLVLAAGLLASALPPALAADASEQPEAANGPAPVDLVHVIPVSGSVEFGLARFIERGIAEAEAAGADLIVLEIDTPGGRVDAALEIRKAIIASPISTVAYVTHWAMSAGALLGLATDRLYMAPGSSIGAAEPRPADEKTISAIRSEFEATARRNGRDHEVAAAMVDADVAVPGLVEQGKILTLPAETAWEIEFIDGIAGNRVELLADLGAGDARVVESTMRGSERFARIVTDPTIAPILLALGFLGLVAELLLPGLGLPGVIGLVSLSLFFGGHMLAGLAGWEVVVLFALGVVLMGIEALTPGFGVFGISGLAAMLLSIFLAAPTATDALRSLFVALAVSIVGGVVLVRYAGARGFWHRIALGERLATEQGYVGTKHPVELVGQRGSAVTPLRPAGTAMIEGRRWDVVTDGSFIAAGQPVQVIAVEGVRIVVTAAADEPGQRSIEPDADDVD